MTRDEFDQKHFPKYGAAYLDFDTKLCYLKRLIQPYKKVSNECFLLQYVAGQGNELKSNFWSIHSSSRFAFELYSWMADVLSISAIYFEKKLKGLYRSPGVPNMDVYIEKDNRIIFIESKFSEKYTQTIDTLSTSYYYDIETKDRKEEVEKRYYGFNNIAFEISSLINKLKKKLLASKDLERIWMNFHQEITHLVGIALTVTSDLTDNYKGKDLEFYNVYYEFEDDINDIAKWFFTEAKEIMNRLLVETGYCKSFEYKYCSAQDFVKKGVITTFDKDTFAFGTNKKQTIGQLLEDNFDFIID